MIIKVVDAEIQRGGKALLLCDDAGVPLPLQVGSKLEQSVGDPSSITVTFLIDGEQNRFA